MTTTKRWATWGESDDNGKNNKPEPAKMEFSMNVGFQFGLTDVTSEFGAEIPGLACVLDCW